LSGVKNKKNMNPEEKAKELVEKLKWYCDGTAMGAFRSEVAFSNAKQCALITVEEIINLDYFSIEGREYWQQVRKQIEIL
jgi:hypothetical protein